VIGGLIIGIIAFVYLCGVGTKMRERKQAYARKAAVKKASGEDAITNTEMASI
jgi:hypothetical protein